jgi:hypothetical protein
VAQFTLHDSWNELKRYTNLKPENVCDLRPIHEKRDLNDRGPEDIIVPPQPARVANRSRPPDRSH